MSLGWRIRVVFILSPFIPLNYRRLAKATGLAAALAVGLARPGAAEIDFNRDIRPVLSRNCFQCHGPDAAKRKAGLRLDTREGATEARDGVRAIDPAGLAKSELLARIAAADPDTRMPPPEANRQLTAGQVKLLAEWVKAGGDYDRHWAFKQPVRRPLPGLAPERRAWAKNTVDVFVAAKLAEAGVDPSPEAAKATLLRRVSLDLVGLPPSPEQIAAFVNDASADAFEKVVDNLLQSPYYGERWGRHWLDAARYADSDGYSHDAARSMWPYRDWVISAVNSDLAFDQFIVEQLAGDLLPDATLAQRVATGFHRNTQINTEGGVDKEQFRIDSIFDRLVTTGEVMFGLTLGCAQCHEHKYDPVSQTEYYQLFAFFNNADEPRIEAPTPVVTARRGEHGARVRQLEAKLKSLTKEDAGRKSVEVSLAKLRKARPSAATTLVMARRKEPRTTRRFVQGDFTRPAETVQPGTPASLHPLDKPTPDRLDFARWVADRDNPLLARVTVNRTWQHLFGRGIVETENDFGSQGIPPTHPKLLDWLAVEFMENGWSLKQIHRLIVTSATYRQASSVRRSDLDQLDPHNRLLARQSRFRLDAEVVRDLALASSGLLSEKMGGPGVFPPQPDGCMDLGQHRKTWKVSSGEDRFRRAAYTYRWRNTPHPALKVFDAPDGLATCTRRIRSNTPLQALTLMNDPAFVELAVGLARRLMTEEESSANRIRLGFQLCLGREPDAEELRLLTELVAVQQTEFAAQAAEAKAVVSKASSLGQVGKQVGSDAALAAWTMASRVLLNLDETITRE
ncbi:MAG: PSD1 and planctomycete cytochrome C domain-containing protein [Verrucomicrobiota bacterium]|jgi:mono/diheme cytochrome c family protein|nr:PSD1 and planctomycete cytochrome C domain-containing protein [Verrucomicrobiota bacterium]